MISRQRLWWFLKKVLAPRQEITSLDPAAKSKPSFSLEVWQHSVYRPGRHFIASHKFKRSMSWNIQSWMRSTSVLGHFGHRTSKVLISASLSKHFGFEIHQHGLLDHLPGHLEHLWKEKQLWHHPPKSKSEILAFNLLLGDCSSLRCRNLFLLCILKNTKRYQKIPQNRPKSYQEIPKDTKRYLKTGQKATKRYLKIPKDIWRYLGIPYEICSKSLPFFWDFCLGTESICIATCCLARLFRRYWNCFPFP